MAGDVETGLNDDDLEICTSKDVEVIPTFDGFGLKEELLRGIYAFGFEKPSRIQQRGIKPMIKGRDVIAQSQSGTGKTATYSISILQNINTKSPKTQALVLSPTRELAVQIKKVLEGLGNYMKIQCHATIGGTKTNDDSRKLERGQHVISGTPGRVLDLIKRGKLHAKSIKVLVLDEADEMLKEGFEQQIYDIYKYLPASVQIIIISATLPKEILEMTNKLMTEPIKILVDREELTLDGIKQYYVDVEKEQWKFDCLLDIYDRVTITQAIVFCNSRKKVDWLADKMRKDGFAVASLHGTMKQKERDATMNEFRAAKSRVLITTDVLARGIDVQQVSIVFNYDFPLTKEAYLHRIGRSGRFGRRGAAINFIVRDDKEMFEAVEKYYSVRLQELPNKMDDLL